MLGAEFRVRHTHLHHSKPSAPLWSHVLEIVQRGRAQELPSVPPWLSSRIRDGGVQPPWQEAPGRLSSVEAAPRGQRSGAAARGAGRLMVRRTLSGSAWSWTTSQRTVMALGCTGAPSMAARGVLTWCGTTRTTAARTLAARRASGATWMFSVWTVWCSVCQATSTLLALRHRCSLSRRPRRLILKRQQSAMCRPAWVHRPSTLALTERARRPVRSRRVQQVRAPIPGTLVAGAC